MSIWREGLPVVVKDDVDIRSTTEFMGAKGTVMSMTNTQEQLRILEGYVKVRFSPQVRGRRWWWIPISDLEEPMFKPSWEI